MKEEQKEENHSKNIDGKEEEEKEENDSNNEKEDSNNDGFYLGSILDNINSNENKKQEINDFIGTFLEFGRGFLNDMGVDTNFTCENCGCSTDDHEHIGNRIWKCKKFNSKCNNDILNNLLK